MTVNDAELTAEIKRRLRIMRACADDTEMQANAVVAWREDPVLFINDLIWTQDPRLLSQNLPADIPLRLFDFQEDFVRWLHELYLDGESGVVEKSRDMGASWCVLGFYVWMWLFKEGCKLGIGSRKEDLVDKKKDPDSLFERLRFAVSRLPKWLRPKGFDPRIHDNFMLLSNPENSATIRGEAGDNIGRGGRSTMYVVDESAYLARPALVDSALGSNSDVIVHVSSANGMNHFHRKATCGAYRVKRLHWTQDPRKSPEWRQKMIERDGPVIVAQEVDIDYSASVEGIIIPAAWVQSAVALYKTHAEELAVYDDAPRVLGLDVADGGGDMTVLVHRAGPMVLRVDERAQTDTNTTKTTRWADRLAQMHGCSLLLYDSIGIGAGIKGELWSLGKERDLGYLHRPVNVGMAPSDRPTFGVERPRDMFANSKAELWWSLRARFERTHLYVTGEMPDADIDTLIALPEHDQLIREISVVTHFLNGRGKIQVESKADLKKRLGPKASPDYADALVLAYSSDVVAIPRAPKKPVERPKVLNLHNPLDLGF